MRPKLCSYVDKSVLLSTIWVNRSQVDYRSGVSLDQKYIPIGFIPMQNISNDYACSTSLELQMMWRYTS